jgi:DNA-binding transcriptional LysR family regulator
VTLAEAKLFKEIAQSKSITRGAACCGISQSAASQHIQELERILGLPLLDRSTRPVALTPAGRLYQEFCRDLLRREEQFQLDLEQLKSDVEGTVRVASIYSIGLSEMSRLKAEFSRRYPKTQLHVDYMRPDKVYDAVIPRNVRVSEAPSYGKPAILYDLKCAGSQAYLQLASEVIRRERRLRAA